MVKFCSYLCISLHCWYIFIMLMWIPLTETQWEIYFQIRGMLKAQVWERQVQNCSPLMHLKAQSILSCCVFPSAPPPLTESPPCGMWLFVSRICSESQNATLAQSFAYKVPLCLFMINMSKIISFVASSNAVSYVSSRALWDVGMPVSTLPPKRRTGTAT